MNNKIFLSGLIIILISVGILGAPFSPNVASITETYFDCQKGSGDMRAAFLIAQGACEPANLTYNGMIVLITCGIIITIIGLIKKQRKN